MIRDLLPHIPALSAPLAAGIGALAVWLRMRPKDMAETRKAEAEAHATDMEVGKRLRDELRAEISELREELEKQDAECRRRLRVMEEAQRVMREALEDAQRVITRNGKFIAEQAATIERLEAKVTRLSGAV